MESIFSTSHSEDLLYSLEEEMNGTTSPYVTDTSSSAHNVWLYSLLAVSLSVALLLCVALVVVLMQLKSRDSNYKYEDDPCDQRFPGETETYESVYRLTHDLYTRGDAQSSHTQHLSASQRLIYPPANEEVGEVYHDRSLDMPDNLHVPEVAKRKNDYYLPNVLTMDDKRRPLHARGVATVMSSDVTRALNTDLDEQDRPQNYISKLEITEEGGTFIDSHPQVTITVDIPAGTVRTPTYVAIVQSYNPLFMPRIDDGKIMSPVIHICPHKLRLEKTMTVTLRLPQMNPSNSYHVLYSPTDIGEECEWIDLAEPGHSVAGISPRVNANAKEVVLSLLHFCVFIIIEKATGERTEAKFCQLQASLLLHPTNDMVQVDVKVSPDDTDDVMTEFDVRQHLCVRNNEKALELTVETSLFDPPAGYSIVPVTPHNMVLPFMLVWRDKSPSTTFHFQLKVSSQFKRDVFLVCRVRAQQQECNEDAVTLDLSRPLKLMANNREREDLSKNRHSFPSEGFRTDDGRGNNPLQYGAPSPPTLLVNKPQRSVQEKANIYFQQWNKHEQEEIQERPSRGHRDARPREDPHKTYVKQTVSAEAVQTNGVITMDMSGLDRIVYHATYDCDNRHIHSAYPQLQLRGPSMENQSANPAEGGGDFASFEQTHQSTAGGGACAESSPCLEHTNGEILSRVHVPQQADAPPKADSDVPPAQNVSPRTFITESAFASSDNAELNMRLIKLFENARTSRFVAQ